MSLTQIELEAQAVDLARMKAELAVKIAAATIPKITPDTRAVAVLRNYRLGNTGEDDVVDVIIDLLHYARKHNFTPASTLLARAQQQFIKELLEG